MEIEKRKIYDEICVLLTTYEANAESVSKEDFYSLLVKIQNNWEGVITCD